MPSHFFSPVRCGAFFLCGLLAAAHARADVVVLKTGERLEGMVKMETATKVILAGAGGSRTIDRATVEKIERGPFQMPAEAAVAPVVSLEAKPITTPAAGAKAAFWPPVKGRAFPDLTLYDRNGRLVKLSSFRGKVIILEPVGMTCPACNAFSGANQVGGFEGVQPQADLAPLEKFFTVRSAGATLDDPRIVWVQLVLYNMQMQAPTVDDLKRWVAHFPALRKPNCVVLAGTPEMIGDASYAMIPGVQLIDRQFVLRSDFRGHGGGDDLGGHLLPLVRQLMK